MELDSAILRKRFEDDKRLDEEGKMSVLRRVRRRMKGARSVSMTLSDLLEEEIQRRMRLTAYSGERTSITPLEARDVIETHLRGYSDTPEETEILLAIETLKGVTDKETKDLLYALSDVSGFESVRKAASDFLRPGR